MLISRALRRYQEDVDTALEQLPETACGYAADLLDPQGRAELFDEVGAIDHLACTAGQNINFPKIADYTLEAANTIFGLRVICALDAVELAPIRVNAVAPGIVRSPLWNQVGSSASNEVFAQVATALPAGRVAEPGDIAKGYVYLMEQEYATGSLLLIDGSTLVM
jgi:NAD(P)-dependent dehydrogenase (short-subunit alcohol dehydrogenase family)